MPDPDRHTRFAPWVPLALVSCLLLAGVPAWGAPTIALDKAGLAASGITPGGRAVWWSLAHERPDSFVTVVHRLVETTDTDSDGVVLFEYEGDLPEASIWVVVDVATGAYGTFTPGDFDVTETALPPESTETREGASDSFRETERSLVDTLLVRAGQGAWDLRTGDGGDADQEPEEGALAFPIDSMIPVGTSPVAPTHYAVGDRLLSIDVDRLELSSVVFSIPPPPPPPVGEGFRAGVRR